MPAAPPPPPPSIPSQQAQVDDLQTTRSRVREVLARLRSDKTCEDSKLFRLRTRLTQRTYSTDEIEEILKAEETENQVKEKRPAVR